MAWAATPAAAATDEDKRMDSTVQDRIRQQITDTPVVLFMKGTPVFPQCGFSAAVVQILSHMGVKFKGIDVLSDPSVRQGVKEFSNWPTVPQLYVKGEFVGGCDIIREMFETGELKQLLEEKGGPVRAAPRRAAPARDPPETDRFPSPFVARVKSPRPDLSATRGCLRKRLGNPETNRCEVDMPAPHILLVEDDPDLLALLTEVLEDEGYRVSGATQRQQARAMLSKGDGDLCVSASGLSAGG